MRQVQLYDDRLDYEENKAKGPFGDYSKPTVYKNSGKPKYSFLDAAVYSNFGVSACPATMDSRYIKVMLDKGYDIVTCKTRRSKEVPANPFPQLLQLDLEGALTEERFSEKIIGHHSKGYSQTNFNFANSFGNNCERPEVWTKDLAKLSQAVKPGQVLIASVFGTLLSGMTTEEYHQDFARTAELAVAAGIKVIELNLSCPNATNEGIVCYTEPAVVDICRRTRTVVGKNVKIIAKIGYYSANQEELLTSIVKRTADLIDGFSAINTMPATIVNKQGQQAFPGKGREKAGVSGSAIKWAGIDMTKRLNEIRKRLGLDFAIIGIGGVMTVQDYQDYISAGADAVQSATGAMWNPNLAAQIKEHLAGRPKPSRRGRRTAESYRR
ncbi:MAG TPA: hypothetical protein VFW90_03965 [Candidatus Saccharimonadales bacterium]|nr:hypothetical protein [Candidatus Saccharimonadales bacterium]